MEQSYLERVLEQAGNGDTLSQLYLGWAYSRHGNQPRNDVQAELWLRKAEQSGDPQALRQLARFIYDNRREEALQLAERLIEKDDFYGFYIMGDIYKLGVLGVEKDAGRARQYFEQASRRGHLVSQLDALKLKYFCPMLNPFALAETIPVAIRIARERRSNASSLAIYT